MPKDTLVLRNISQNINTRLSGLMTERCFNKVGPGLIPVTSCLLEPKTPNFKRSSQTQRVIANETWSPRRGFILYI